MTSRTDRAGRGRDQEGLAYAVGGLLLLVLGILEYPAIVAGGLLAALVVSLPPRRLVGQTREAWRRVGVWESATGGALFGAWLALRWPLDLPAASRAFSTAWRDGIAVHPGALLEYPWGWAPLAVAIALLAGGAVTWWRAR